MICNLVRSLFEKTSKYLFVYRSFSMMSMMLSSSMLRISASPENLRCIASRAFEIVTFRACLRPNLSGLVEGEKLLTPLAWLATEEAAD